MSESRSALNLISDATEAAREETAEILRRNEQRFQSLIENASDIIAVIDARGALLYESPSIERITGFRSGELIGQSAFELVHPDDRERVVRAFVRGVETNLPATMIEYRHLCKDGSWRTLETIASNQLADPSIGGIVLNSRDITERRQMERELARSQDQLRQAAKMEAVGRLAGGIAHDFNNLLAVIMGYSDLLLKRSDTGDESQKKISEIRRAAGRAASLTAQLLAFSRKQMLQPEVLDINRIVTNTETMLRRIIGEDIALRTALASSLWRVVADPTQIEQIIINLAINARDAMPIGGRLTIETQNVELSADSVTDSAEAGEHVMIAVSDTGHGMTPEVRANIFEPFFTTKEQGKGTGLGLSTVYGIVKQSGGNIWVYSEVGIGTTFKIYLPHATPSAESIARVSGNLQRPMPRGTETILLVEDEDTLRRMVREILEECGYTVMEAASGREAIEACARRADGEPLDLLLTDVVMPGMGGRRVAEEIARRRSSVRVLYMSGYTDDAIVHHGIVDRDVAFLQKPFSPDSLARKVREVMDEGGQVSGGGDR